ncbi:Intradiol ring-cleavage dioxygenase [Immersiella caudata]|uniref:Intradiol ring-cleavage dioxygenase n=1 Tax=Immersiella caudata TaxID=314043 RepID=A0AA39WKB6_9PEZI|nr:Intradiol ring-cleavage dioxygenase [Immersiella caudata]
MKLALIASVLVAALDTTLAHGDDPVAERQEQLERRRFLEIHPNNLDHCAEKFARDGVFADAARRRYRRAASLMAPAALHAAIKKRQTSSLNKDHKSTKGYTPQTDPATIFADSNSCILSPQATEGPFYVLGESIRSNIVDDQVGIPLHIDFQIYDVNTCKPIKGTYFEMWNANGTGVYSGALSVVNGLQGMTDKANLDRTYLRGSQLSDDNGVVQFNTLFPGHYDGRAPHIHVMSHVPSAKAEANNTLWHNKATYAGQIFFDQALVDAVKKTAPYSTNRQNLLRNSADSILLQEAQTSDPFFNYVLLGGNDLTKGVFAWYSVGINQTFTRDIMAAAMRGKDGGKMVTTNPKIPGLDAIFPGGFPTAYQPAYGGGGGQPARPTGRP